MKYLLAISLLLFASTAAANHLPENDLGTVTWYCQSEAALEEVILAPDDSALNDILSKELCSITDIPIPGIITKFMSRHYDTRVNQLVEIYEISTPYGLVYVSVPVKGFKI